MNNNIALITLFFASFMLSGCGFVIPSTHYLNANQQSDFESRDWLFTPIALPYIEELQDENKSGALLVSEGRQAILHRISLARMARYSIEIQTYIYKNELASRVLMHEIYEAANRGVKVKILIDDNGLDSDYSDVIALNHHPNIQVRIFNPYRNRIKLFRLGEMIFRFDKINRRMHNKLFIADNMALIIGGRNIADSYFDSSVNVNFADTEAFFIGKIAQDAKESFKQYWQYHRAIPVEFLPSKRKMRKFMKHYPSIIKSLESDEEKWQQYSQAINEAIDNYQQKNNQMYWGEAKLIADDVKKIDEKNPTSKIYEELKDIWEGTNDSIYISSAYLVPGKRGLNIMKDSLQNGLNLFVLTNSLSSMDALPVYAGWERYRDNLVRLGAQVYEYRKGEDKVKIRGRTSRGASLHSKVLVFDKQITWIGSFNLDPRSSVINTEIMATFDNKEFATEATKLIHIDMQRAWRLELRGSKIHKNGETKGGKIWWCAPEYVEDFADNEGKQISLIDDVVREGGELCYKRSPDTSVFLRLLNVFMRLLPENQI
ncbi:phospholipase D family protein [Helicobacter sp. T3_23-1059]